MKKVLSHIILLCCIMSLFPAVVFAAENDVDFPITVKADPTTFYYEIQDQILIEKIVIEENATNSFEENQEFIFCVDTRILGSNDPYILFEQKDKVEIEDGSLKVEYSTENGKLLVIIKESDPSKQESFTISNIQIKLTEPFLYRDLCGEHSLLCKVSGPNSGLVTVLNEFIILSGNLPSAKKPMDVVIKVNGNFMLMNGKEQRFSGPIYISDDGHTMLPIRDMVIGFAEAFSHEANVSWDNDTKAVIFLYGGTVITFTNGTKEVYMNGVKKDLSHKTEIRDGRMYISFRDFCDIFYIPQKDILWDNNTKTITVNTPEVTDIHWGLS